jgi:DNA repair protein RecO (recombination protein O)
MLSKTRGIVLHSTPYNDKYAIVHIYTEGFGRASYMIGRNRGKKSIVSKALFMPLSILEMEVEYLPKREIQRIKESRLCFPLSEICTDPARNVIALFVAEILYRVVKDTEPDARLFDYLYKSIHLLENTVQGIANYHLVFLLGLLRYLGVSPQTDTQREGYYFDMLNGIFVKKIPAHRHYLDKEESTVFARLLRISFENMSLYSFSRRDRVNIINRIIEYYRLHLPEFQEIKSIAVMQSLFD